MRCTMATEIEEDATATRREHGAIFSDDVALGEENEDLSTDVARGPAMSLSFGAGAPCRHQLLQTRSLLGTECDYIKFSHLCFSWREIVVSPGGTWHLNPKPITTAVTRY
jgi:hypothetical protein